MFSMAYMPTPEALALAMRVKATVEQLHLSVKEIVDPVGQSEQYISDMFAGRRALSLWRFFRIEGFQAAFGKVLLGPEYLVLQRGDIRVIHVGKRKALKASLPVEAKQEIA